MRSRFIMPLLALPLLAAVPMATPSPTTGGSATPTVSATLAAAPTPSSQASTASAAPPWTGLPVRTYANLKKRILGDHR